MSDSNAYVIITGVPAEVSKQVDRLVKHGHTPVGGLIRIEGNEVAQAVSKIVGNYGLELAVQDLKHAVAKLATQIEALAKKS